MGGEVRVLGVLLIVDDNAEDLSDDSLSSL